MELIEQPTTANELSIAKPEELIPVLSVSGTNEAIQNQVVNTLASFIAKAKEWNSTIESLQITSADEIGKMKMAKEGRLTLKNMRINGKKTVEGIRKSIKDRMANDLNEDKLWMKSWQIVEDIYDNLESKLEEKEKFAERLEKERIQKMKEDREAQLSPYSAFVPFGIDLATMGEEDFQKVLSGAKLQHEAKIEQDKKAEELKQKQKVYDDRRFVLAQYTQFVAVDRLTIDSTEEEFNKLLADGIDAKQAFDIEQSLIKKENERLKLEAEKKQQELEAQEAEKRRLQKEAEDKQKEIERQETERLRLKKEAEENQRKLEQQEAEKARLKREAEEAEARQKELEQKNESLKKELASSEQRSMPAPSPVKIKDKSDNEILLTLALQLTQTPMPVVKSASAKKVVADVKTLLQKISDHIHKQLQE